MYFERATVTSKGQITIPIAIQKKLNLQKGDKLVFIEDTHGIRIANASDLTIQNKEADVKRE